MDHPFLLTSTRLRSLFALLSEQTFVFVFFFEKNPRIPRFFVLINRLRSALEVRASLVLAGRWCWNFYSILFIICFQFCGLDLASSDCLFEPFSILFTFFMIFSGGNTGLETDAMKARCGIFMLPAGLGLLS